MTSDQKSYLLHQFKAEKLTYEEWEAFVAIVHEGGMDSLLENDFLDAIQARTKNGHWTPKVAHDVWENIAAATTSQPAIIPIKRLKYWAAAVVLLMVTGIYYYSRSPQTTELQSGVTITRPSVIHGDQALGVATLTLSDGSVISMDQSGVSKLAAMQAKNLVLNGDRLVYHTDETLHQMAASANQMNTLQTPSGKQFSLQLSDGTKVWLNAAASITYPEHFSAKERIVSITGEVYFEVAANTQAPFKVKTRNQIIEVLGTNFNIEAYQDDPVEKTTLLTGSIKVQPSQKAAAAGILKPGEQAIIQNTPLTPNKHLEIKGVDVSQVVAWKNGIFSFQDASIEAVAKQLSRWYNIDVVFEGEVPAMQFGGKMGRDLSLDDALLFLKKSKVNCRMENKNKLIISP